MFARIKKSGQHQYLQIVENHREGSKTIQRVLSTIGRMDQLQAKGDIEKLIRSLSRFSERVVLILSGRSEVDASAKKIGPWLIFGRLWEELGIRKIIKGFVEGRKFEFDVERAIFLTVLHRLFASGSDRSCEKWHQDYRIEGVEDLSLHHLYRAMAFLGSEIEDKEDKTLFSPRCTKDLIEEAMFHERRDLFTSLDLVFFDTTSIYFEGEGGETLGAKGHSRDHRSDLNQMVVGAVLDHGGNPLCCEMWPGNTADVKALIPVTDRIRERFHVGQFCVVADRGMISSETLEELDQRKVPYILGARMRRVKEVREEVLSRGGRFREVRPEGESSQDPSPLQVKEVWVKGRRYVVCLNPREARKDEQDRQILIEALKEKLQRDPKALIGNRGYRKFLKIDRDHIQIDPKKIEEDARFDGKWVLQTTADLPTDRVALKYKELWQVEQVFRDMKSILLTRPIYHQMDETIRGHVFCSFLALVLRKELGRRLEKAGHRFEWADLKQDLKSLQEVTLEENGKRLVIRSECRGVCGKVFQAVGVSIPPTIRELQ
jgi:transposase